MQKSQQRPPLHLGPASIDSVFYDVRAEIKNDLGVAYRAGANLASRVSLDPAGMLLGALRMDDADRTSRRTANLAIIVFGAVAAYAIYRRI